MPSVRGEERKHNGHGMKLYLMIFQTGLDLYSSHAHLLPLLSNTHWACVDNIFLADLYLCMCCSRITHTRGTRRNLTHVMETLYLTQAQAPLQGLEMYGPCQRVRRTRLKYSTCGHHGSDYPGLCARGEEQWRREVR